MPEPVDTLDSIDLLVLGGGMAGLGSDTGGLYVRGCAGGIASALVFGLAAARTATRQVLAS